MRKKKMMNKKHYIKSLVMLATMLLVACGSGSDGIEDTPPTTSSEAPKEIKMTSNVYRRLEATRTSTYDNAVSLQTEGSFTCTAYDAGTLTSYISTTTVDWIAGASRWGFNNGNDHYYWPASGDLDFFGYMPKAANLPTEAPYISDIDYTAAHNVTFTCSGLPMTNTGQGNSLKEFMFGMALAQNEENAGSGVPLTFQHPFARIKLQLAASHPDITINSITFRGIYNNGNYDHSASPKWSTSGDATNFVLSLTGSAAVFNDNPASETQIGEYYIMIPQDWAGVIEVNADCLFWGEKKNYPSLTTTVPTNLQPGYSYTYTFNINPDDLIVNITTKFTEQW